MTMIAALAAGWWVERKQGLEQWRGLVEDNTRLQGDSKLLHQFEDLENKFMKIQRDKEEAARQEAIARLKERGILPADYSEQKAKERTGRP